MSYYTYLKKGSNGRAIVLVSTNLKRLVEFDPNLNYNTLLRVLSKEKKDWWEDYYSGIIISRSRTMVKGLQRIKRGPGVHNRNI